MVKLPESINRRSSQFMEQFLDDQDSVFVEDEVLQAFQLGARMHVERSMDECKKVVLRVQNNCVKTFRNSTHVSTLF